MKSVLLLLIVLDVFFSSFISATNYTCDPTLSCGCAVASTTIAARIVGGEAASNNVWGWMGSLRQYNSHICGASLLSSEYAVTAAHCVQGVLSTPSVLSLVVGTNYLDDTSSSTVQRRTVAKIIIHPNYKSASQTNDIAILKFSPFMVTSKSRLAFICLPNSNEDPFRVNSKLVATGWGYTLEGAGVVSNSLQQVTVKAYSPTSTECLQSGLTDSNLQFCAGVNGGGKGEFFLIYTYSISHGSFILSRHMPG